MFFEIRKFQIFRKVDVFLDKNDELKKNKLVRYVVNKLVRSFFFGICLALLNE